MNRKKWIYERIDKKITQQLMEQHQLSELTAMVLQNRMDVIGDDMSNLGKMATEVLYDPFLMKGMHQAVKRIHRAIEKKEKIAIYGDYDADGVTSITILHQYLEHCGADVDFYIPDRIDEGYGIHRAALDSLKEAKTDLMITVDTGITAVEETAYAMELGMDVIITDHHECKEQIPTCTAVIDPKQPDCGYPFKELAGVGVVFKLITALDGGDVKELIRKYIALVCLGTIADVAPLVDENRAFVKLGLKFFAHSGNIGIQALLKETNLDEKPVTAGNIGFVIAPRINAAGRLGSAKKSAQLFLCNDQTKAQQIAADLSTENRNRQTMEQDILQQAMAMIEKDHLEQQDVIVVAGQGWHHGVIGIVSSRITERYYKPSVLISIDGDMAKGSGRSISSFNLFDALTHVSGCLTQFGGHSLAAGLSLPAQQVDTFREELNQYAKHILKPSDFVPKITVDAPLHKRHLTMENVEKLSFLEPYGMGNPTPLFSFLGAKIKKITAMTEGRHMRLMLERDGAQLDAVGFQMGEYTNHLRLGDVVDVAGHLGINEYNETRKLQLVLRDVKIARKDR